MRPNTRVRVNKDSPKRLFTVCLGQFYRLLLKKQLPGGGSENGPSSPTLTLSSPNLSYQFSHSKPQFSHSTQLPPEGAVWAVGWSAIITSGCSHQAWSLLWWLLLHFHLPLVAVLITQTLFETQHSFVIKKKLDSAAANWLFYQRYSL